MTCSSCRQDAPTIVRGVRAYCSACGAPRPLFSAAGSVNMAGQPAKVGGTVASAFGLVALTIGGVLALVLGSIAKILFGTAILIVAPILVLTLLVALPLLFGGRRLNRAGEDRARAAQEQAVFALASQRRGVVTVREVARALEVHEEEADAVLTALAKRPDGRVTLELDDSGGLSYLFHDLVPTGGTRVRVAEQPWQPPARVNDAATAPRVIDAELIDEAQAGDGAAVRRASR